jgi:hypothetical protein
MQGLDEYNAVCSPHSMSSRLALPPFEDLLIKPNKLCRNYDSGAAPQAPNRKTITSVQTQKKPELGWFPIKKSFLVGTAEVATGGRVNQKVDRVLWPSA